MSNEQIYLYRRKGLSDYATCDRAHYVELSQHKLFETMVCYASPEPEEGGHEGRQLEWERCENKRLRAELGECKGEYDRAVNKVDALRERLAEAHSLFADVLSIDVPRTAQSLERMRSILSAIAEPAKTEQLVWLDMEELPEHEVGARYRIILDDVQQACTELKKEDGKRWFRGDDSGTFPIDEIQAWLPIAEPANKECAQ